MTAVYVHAHVVSLEETNSFGTVYFSNYFVWQGKCREMFLRKHAAEIVTDPGDTLLVTTSAHCDFLAELDPLDEVQIHMHATDITANQMRLKFEFWRTRASGPELVATGHQTVAWIRPDGVGGYDPIPVPPKLLRAIESYRRSRPRSGTAPPQQAQENSPAQRR